MSTVAPITNKKQIRLAEDYLKKYFDEAYYLIWRVGIDTGLRITDITELKYEDVNMGNGRVRIMENKGTRARKTRAKLNVLKVLKEELLIFYQGKHKAQLKIYTTPITDILGEMPRSWQIEAMRRIKEAQEKVQPKWREAHLSEKTLTLLRNRAHKFQQSESDHIFSRATLSSNRARNQKGVISRQACWKVFSQLSTVLYTVAEDIKIGCHSMRKSFARHLYFSSDKDISLLMTIIGHQSIRTTLHYIGISDDEAIHAQLRLHRYLT